MIFPSAGSLVTGVGLTLLDTTASTLFQSLTPGSLMPAIWIGVLGALVASLCVAFTRVRTYDLKGVDNTS